MRRAGPLDFCLMPRPALLLQLAEIRLAAYGAEVTVQALAYLLDGQTRLAESGEAAAATLADDCVAVREERRSV